jgi:curved DNA-binding protein CbpA
MLGVPSNSGDREIKVAYHKLARTLHPDKAASEADRTRKESEFAQVSQAYNTLKDREKRAAYDKSLEIKRQQEMNRTGASGDSGGTAQKPAPVTGGGGGGIDKGRAGVARRAYIKGMQQFAVGEYAKASEFFEVAVKNNESEANYHAKLAQTLLRGRRSFSRATEAAQQAISLDPYNSEFRLILAELYEQAGSKSMAIKTYQEILRWDPTNETALIAVGDSMKAKSLLDTVLNLVRGFTGRK